MKESIALALLLLLALVLIPLLAIGGENVGLLNPFDTAASGPNTSEAEQTASSSQAQQIQDELNPNEDAEQALDDLLAQYSSSGATNEPVSLTDFRIKNLSTGEVETVSARDYVIGAVASEMPASFSVEALKAQAVAAHTYALRKKLDAASLDADFEADPSNYKGYMTEELARVWFGDNFDVYWSRIVGACDEVLGKVLVYQTEPIIAAYHSMSAGLTESAETVWQTGVPYLVPVESAGDMLARNFEVETDVTADEVKGLLVAKFPNIKLPTDKTKWFAVKTRSQSGTITELTAGDMTMTGQDAREMFTLRSANFTVEYANGKFTFTTLGYGHGVGLSQYGADYMARQGATYDEILAHYYSDASLVDLSELKLAKEGE